MKYYVHVRLDEEYTIEADSEEEAFIKASDFAISGGCWTKTVEPIREDDE